jgi:hypothetical protein
VAHNVRAVVVVDGFHHDGHDYHLREQLELPAALADAWAAAGYVRLADDFAINARNASEIADAFIRNGR